MTTQRQEHISPYDREDALLDGLLVDIAATAEQEYLWYPTAISQRAYAALVRQHCAHTGEDEHTRLHQICDLLCASYRCKQADLPLIRSVIPTADTPTFFYFAEVHMLMELTEEGERRWTVYLKEEA